MKKAISALALTVALATLSFGAAEAADCKVGVAMYTLSAPYFAAQVAAAVDQAKKAGCEVSQSDGQNDMSKQIADVEDMVAKGVNLLILNPRDPEGLVAAADAATKAGVKVVVMDFEHQSRRRTSSRRCARRTTRTAIWSANGSPSACRASRSR